MVSDRMNRDRHLELLSIAGAVWYEFLMRGSHSKKLKQMSEVVGRKHGYVYGGLVLDHGHESSPS